MLLVKSKESKNSDRKNALKSGGWGLLALLIFPSFAALAEPQSLSSPTSIVSIFLSLLLVVGVVFMLAFLMRRFNVTPTGNSKMKVVASMMAGHKERIVVLQVGDQQHLVGITAHNISHLATLDENLKDDSVAMASPFKDKLVQAMAGKLNPAVQNKEGDAQ
ncbi:flagellar biosynthetic protein FliO [Aestuariibacter salexigens]|uniref:flagellar biosynthetic protein FliO n=1 Tax=Aestuariibacter salexigens TaxID=226010 RepID=UPI0009FF485C|nr:flagellar biosynthetic protein FliO [Aestuariibacter salexigens]